MTMLGTPLPSPMLEILLLFVMPSGLVVPTLPFMGSGLTGLTTPDMVFLGVGGKGERAGGIGLCIRGFGEGEGLLPKRDSRVFFWSEGTESRRSMEDAGRAGDRDGTMAS